MDLFLRFPPNTSEAAHFTAISRQKIQFYTSFDTKINMAALKGEMTQREAHTPPPHLPTQGKKCVYRVVAVCHGNGTFNSLNEYWVCVGGVGGFIAFFLFSLVQSEGVSASQ